MRNRLRHNVKFCKKGEMFEFVKLNISEDKENIFIGECVSIYKSYTTQYRFKIVGYNSKTYKAETQRYKNMTRPKLNNFYSEDSIVEVDQTLLAKIKLIEGNK